MMLWDVTRASAMVAFGCYTLVVTWGILLAGRGFRPAAPQMAFHRFLSSLGLAALATHVGSLMLDRYAKVYPHTLLGMGATNSVRAGVAALWLSLALPFSMRLKKAGVLPARAWRALHYFGYATWGLALAHGITTGSDSGSQWAVGLYGAAAAVVGAAAWWRWLERPAPARKQA
jgi:methionine sulfoxide reductase heme-binding subunit